MHADVNAVVGGYLRDMAFAQSLQQKMFGYKRAAAAILALDVPLTDLIGPDGTLPRIAGIGPGSTRIIREILDTGESPTVERAIDGSGRRTDIDRRRQLRRHFLSRAEVRRALLDGSLAGPALEQYRAICRCTLNGATAIPRAKTSITRWRRAPSKRGASSRWTAMRTPLRNSRMPRSRSHMRVLPESPLRGL